MNIIYTWFKNRYKSWYSEEFEILTLATSIKNASKYYKNIILYTNEDSVKYLEGYNLPAQIIIVEEDTSKLWVINKINTYELQKESFIHIDADFILLERLPVCFEKARLGFQSNEDFFFNYYDRLKSLVLQGVKIKINTDKVYNFGIYVCNDLDTNKKYCSRVRKLIKKIKHIKPLLAFNCIVEQYSMSSLLEELDIAPSLLVENISDLDESKVIHLMHNKNSEEYFKKVTLIT